MIGAEPVERPTPADLARLLMAFMAHPAPMVKVSRPARLRVRDRSLAAALRSIAGDAIPHVEVVARFEVLDAVAADLTRALAGATTSGHNDPLPDDEQTGLLFRAAVAFYNAKPWLVLSDDTPVRIQLGDAPPQFASVMGYGGRSYGLALFTDAAVAQSEAALMRERSMAVTFVAESEVPDDWRKLRRAKRWPIASPSAFPLPLLHEAGRAGLPGRDDMRTLEHALVGVAALVARHGKRLAQRQPAEASIDVSAHAGVQQLRVGAQFGRSTTRETAAGEGGRIIALEEIRAWALELPDAPAVFARMAWSFFRDGQPSYVRGTGQREAAKARFLEWALFAARLSKRTLAERALDVAGTELSPEQRVECERIIHPRAGIFRVERVDRDAGMDVRDELRGEALRVRERLGTRKLRPGHTIIGMLHAIGGDEFVMAGGTLFFPKGAASESPAALGDTEAFAPMLESVFFGATEDWIQTVKPARVRSAYEAFRAALAATGDQLPGYAALQGQIRKADMPTDVFKAISGQVVWWTETEFAVMAAFLMRIWNSTPRPELGGASPDDRYQRPLPL